MLFETTKTITLRDVDGAGVLFFARYLSLAHDVYEELMAARGVSFRRLIEEDAYILPVVHAESDHYQPLWTGDRVVIRIDVVDIGKRTFTLEHTFVTLRGDVAARCRTKHVAVDKKTGRAAALPEEVVRALSQ